MRLPYPLVLILLLNGCPEPGEGPPSGPDIPATVDIVASIDASTDADASADTPPDAPQVDVAAPDASDSSGDDAPNTDAPLDQGDDAAADAESDSVTGEETITGDGDASGSPDDTAIEDAPPGPDTAPGDGAISEDTTAAQDGADNDGGSQDASPDAASQDDTTTVQDGADNDGGSEDASPDAASQDDTTTASDVDAQQDSSGAQDSTTGGPDATEDTFVADVPPVDAVDAAGGFDTDDAQVSVDAASDTADAVSDAADAAADTSTDAGCTPTCGTNVCGDDGCGGLCGACALSEECINGNCITPTGLLCPYAFVVDAVPYADNNDTEIPNTAGSYELGNDACPDHYPTLGFNAQELVYRFQPPATGDYTFTLNSDFNAAMYLTSTCDEWEFQQSCVGAADDCSNCVESMTLSLNADQEYFLFVDGSFGSDAGNYALTIDVACDPSCPGLQCGSDGCGGTCGACDAGEQCVSGLCEVIEEPDACQGAETIGDLPYSTDTFIWGGPQNFSFNNCPGASSGGNGHDRFYKLTAPIKGKYQIDVTPTPGVQFNTYVVRDCTKVNQTCLGANLYGSVDVVLEAGEVVYIIVDGNTTADWGDYTLAVDVCEPDCAGAVCGIDAVCGISCGQCPSGQTCGPQGQCGQAGQGDTCATAFQVDTVPFSGNASTSTSTDAFEFEDCPYNSVFTYGDGVKDQVWQFTAPAVGIYTATLYEQYNSDAILAVAEDCADVVGTCQEWGNACFVDAANCDVTVTMELQAGESRTLIVDGYDPADVGGYRLDIEAQCQQDCSGKVCGDDPCLGSCGTCPKGQACDAAGQCQAAPALVINEIDYNPPGSDTEEFVEIYNAGSAAATLADYTFESVNGSNGSILGSAVLSESGAATLAPGEYLVIGQDAAVAGLPGSIAMGTSSFLQNGGADGDAVRLVHATDGVVEAVSYTAVVSGANEGGTHAGSDPGAGTLQRCPNGADSDDNATDFAPSEAPSPGVANTCG